MVSGSGTIDAAGAYIAPGSPGTDTVRVSDNAGTTQDAVVTISALTTNVDYEVTAVTDTSPTTVGGDTLSGSFTLTNTGSSGGTKDIEWEVYVSKGNTTFSADDILVDMGTETPLISSGSVVVNFTGGWPTTAGSYYILARTTAADDIADTSNNKAASTVVTVTSPPAADVDYLVNTLPAGGSSALTGSAFADSFTIQNTGTASGTQNVYWTVYISVNMTLDGTDLPVDTGSIGFLNAGQTSGNINFNGNWPETAGTYYLLISVSAGEDVNNTNDEIPTASDYTITEPDIDYEVISVTNTGTPADISTVISETFQVQNTGMDNSSSDIIWSAYISADSFLDGGDTIFDSGSIISLNSGVSSGNISLSGSWPSISGSYFLIVTVSSADEIDSTNNTLASGAFTITDPDIDYEVISVTNTGTPADISTAISETFQLQNTGGDNGSSDILWSAYISTDTFLDGSDTIFDSGSIISLNSGALSGNISLSGTWPSVAGTYYLILAVSSADETDNTNNTLASGAFTITDPDIDYIVTPGSITTTGNPALGGGSISETFTIRNDGADNGSANVYWSAYISTDTTFDDPGDTPVDSGWISSLNGGAVSAAVSIDSGSWPVVASTTDYYLFVNVSSADETAGNEVNNNEYVTFTVNVPDIDYEVISLTNNTPSANINDPISETFEVQNTGGNNGSADILWAAYISSDTILDGGDTVIDSGSRPSLNSTVASGNIPVTGTWSEGAGNFYLIVTVSSSDETDTGNNKLVSGPFTITAPGNVDYTVSDVTSTFTIATTGGVLSESFDITNVGGLAGGAIVNWEAFASSDNVWDAGDTSLGTGSISGLGAGATQADIAIIQNWNVASPGDYYLIVKVDSTDDTLTGNDTGYSGPFTVNDPPDYIFESVNLPVEVFGGNLNEDIDGAGGGIHTFTIRENAGFPGKQTISWKAYLSTDSVLDGGDSIFDSGTIAALGAGAAAADIPVVGSLPGSYGYYYIILQLIAGDDSNPGNNSYVSSKIYVWDTVNIDTDTDDDVYLSDAEDYALLLNPGDTVTINGTIDAIGYYDLFKLMTGQGVGGLQVLLTWATGLDTMDLYIYDDDGSVFDSSIDKVSNQEPKAAQAPLLTAVTPFTVYYPSTRVFLAGNIGDPYTMTITAVP